MVVDEELPMNDPWRTKDGKVAIFRLVYHGGDLDTASYPAGYAQRNPRLAPLTSPPRYPLQVLAADGELHYAEAAGGRINAAGVFRLRDTAPRGRTPR